jgi:ABC-type lipoprotein export system ATPase subunit
MLELRGVCKSYRLGDSQRVDALRGVSLSVMAGESVALLGRSGSGKSSLLHLAGLVDSPSRGEVLFDGVELSGKSEASRAGFRRDHLGFVFQSYHLVSVLTVGENVALPALLKGVGRAEASTRAETCLRAVGLGDHRGRRVNQLSGGERQRVAMARALMNRPRLILADEPTANLDAATGAKVVELLVELCRREGTAVLMATHDRALAARFGRTVEILDGDLIEREPR